MRGTRRWLEGPGGMFELGCSVEQTYSFHSPHWHYELNAVDNSVCVMGQFSFCFFFGGGLLRLNIAPFVRLWSTGVSPHRWSQIKSFHRLLEWNCYCGMPAKWHCGNLFQQIVIWLLTCFKTYTLVMVWWWYLRSLLQRVRWAVSKLVGIWSWQMCWSWVGKPLILSESVHVDGVICWFLLRMAPITLPLKTIHR